MAMTDFRITGILGPESEEYLFSQDVVIAHIREQGMALVRCRFCVDGEKAMSLIPIPLGLIDDSEFDLDARCREMSQTWAKEQKEE